MHDDDSFRSSESSARAVCPSLESSPGQIDVVCGGDSCPTSRRQESQRSCCGYRAPPCGAGPASSKRAKPPLSGVPPEDGPSSADCDCSPRRTRARPIGVGGVGRVCALPPAGKRARCGLITAIRPPRQVNCRTGLWSSRSANRLAGATRRPGSTLEPAPAPRPAPRLGSAGAPGSGSRRRPAQASSARWRCERSSCSVRHLSRPSPSHTCPAQPEHPTAARPPLPSQAPSASGAARW